MKFEIDLETLNKVLGYLGEQPYIKVYKLVEEIQKNSKPVQPSTTTTTQDKKTSDTTSNG